MSTSPVLLIHILGGTVGLLSGAAAMIFRKGSRRHGVSGSVFVVSMIALTVTGTYMALAKHDPGTALGGALTFYMVTTAWMTARRKPGDKSILDWGALLVVLTVAAFEITYGLQAALSPRGLKYGYPAPLYLIFAGIALLAATGDIRILVRGGRSGTQRLARHLWRMCFALFVASASIFIARPHLFPVILRRTGVLVLLGFLPLLLMIFWLIRVRFKKRAVSPRVPKWEGAPALAKMSGAWPAGN